MLRYKDKENLESRFAQVDEAVERWKECSDSAVPGLLNELHQHLMISLIYHDSALEGEVLSLGEIKAAIDQNIISDTSLIPAYEDTKSFFAASGDAFTQARNKRKPLKLETVREIYSKLAGDSAGKDLPYRKENPLHRLYYHDISPPEKIAARMKKLGEWLESSEAKDLHPVERAAETHWRLMAIFPWTKQSGRTARIVANYQLVNAGLPLAIIHSLNRQRYYEALKADAHSLVVVYLEAVETTATSSVRVFQEAAAGRRAS